MPPITAEVRGRVNRDDRIYAPGFVIESCGRFTFSPGPLVPLPYILVARRPGQQTTQLYSSDTPVMFALALVHSQATGEPSKG